MLDKNFVVIAGDFNARIGSRSHETSPSVIGIDMYHDQTNTNTNLVDFCEEQILISAFHCQPRKKNHIWTREHPNMRRSKAKIDHILIRNKWINSLNKLKILLQC